MRRERTIERLKLALVLVACAITLFAGLGERVRAGQEQPQRSFEIVGVEVPLEKRLGVDDGASFIIHFGGDTHGNLDACG